MKPGLPYNEAAELRMPDGPTWHCKTCGHNWNDNERMARYCCASDAICRDCDCVISKNYVRCDACGKEKRACEWLEKPEVEWNGEFPIANWDSSSEHAYFYDMRQFVEWLEERKSNSQYPESEWHQIRDARIVGCEKMSKPTFRFLDLFETSEVDSDFWPLTNSKSDRIEDEVNEWIASEFGDCWMQTEDRLRASDLQEVVDKYLKETR